MKAILVIDMPDNNAELFKEIFGIYSEEFWSYSEEHMLDFINRKPSCSLKPMPEKMEHGKETYTTKWLINGWNFCIDKILGVTE